MNVSPLIKNKYLACFLGLLSLALLVFLGWQLLGPSQEAREKHMQNNQQNMNSKEKEPTVHDLMIAYDKLYVFSEILDSPVNYKEIGVISESVEDLTVYVEGIDPPLLKSNFLPKGSPVYQLEDSTLVVNLGNTLYRFTPRYAIRPSLNYEGKVYLYTDDVMDLPPTAKKIGNIKKRLVTIKMFVKKIPLLPVMMLPLTVKYIN